MKCWMCGREESFFLDRENRIRNSLSRTLEEYEAKLKAQKEKYAEECGYTKPIKEKVNKIKEEYLSMTIGAVVENRNAFIALDSNIAILIDYYEKRNRMSSKETLNELKNAFNDEPASVPDPEGLLHQVSSIKNYFNKDRIFPGYFRKELPPSIGGFDDSIERTLPENDKKDYLNSVITHVFFCPICEQIIHNASQAAHNVVEAQNDYGDDEDY